MQQISQFALGEVNAVGQRFYIFPVVCCSIWIIKLIKRTLDRFIQQVQTGWQKSRLPECSRSCRFATRRIEMSYLMERNALGWFVCLLLHECQAADYSPHFVLGERSIWRRINKLRLLTEHATFKIINSTVWDAFVTLCYFAYGLLLRLELWPCVFFLQFIKSDI